jgi:Zn-dependent peptidase ImmA (M78 family)/DNA-binding XRE family transcriptional regulator
MENVLEKLDPKNLGVRLNDARRARGLTQQQVADEMELARTTIVAIEKGERKLTSSELIRFAKLYGRDVSHFLNRRPPTNEFLPQFRTEWNREFAQTPGLEGVGLELQKFAEDYLELERLNGIEHFTKDAPQYDISGISPEQAAEEIATAERNRLGIGDGPISNLRDRLEMDVGLKIFYFEMPSAISGCFAFADALGGCIGINSKHPRDRRHWSLAHEFGHFLTSRYQVEVTFLKGDRRQSVNERFADSFAENFLMPASGLNRRFTEINRSSKKGVTMAEICQLADLYQVSVQALVIRLENLKRIANGTWENMAHTGFKPREAQRLLGIDANPPIKSTLPKWYMKLAVIAYEEEKISEGQLAKFLRADRVTARSLVESLSSDFQEQGNGFVSMEVNFAQEIHGR